MTTLKAPRFNLRRADASSPAAAPQPEAEGVKTAAPQTPNPSAGAQAKPSPRPEAGEMLFDNDEDGFGDTIFPTAAKAKQAAQPAPQPAPASPSTGAPSSAPQNSATQNSGTQSTRRMSSLAAEAPVRPASAAQAQPPAAGTNPEAELDAIRKEGLTGRQLRTARNLAQRHNLPATSDYDAVRQLRARGLDPFLRGSVLDLVTADTTGQAPAPAADGTARALTPLPGDGVRLPQTVKPIQMPSTEERSEVNHAAEILRMQQDIARRRRRKLSLLFARLFVFVLLPTIVAGWFYTSVATRLYGTKSEFVIQQSENPMASGGIGGLLQGTGMATSQDSIAVQGYLQSRDAMLRLERDLGFREHFKGPAIDPLIRLPEDATLEEAYKLYKRYMLISYDPSEGIIRMEAIGPKPDLSAQWSQQLISYAEEQVDQLTQRLREDSMKGARDSYVEAEAGVVAAQQRMVELQERYEVVSSETEIGLLTTQIGALETQLTQERLAVAQMESNRTPNQARLEPVKRRITTLEAEITALRKRLTQGETGNESLARIQGELLVAQADLQTRQMILSQSLQAMENARLEANRQVRYLSLSVSPVPPDEPTYPRTFENTLVTMLILLGIYLMVSMTFAILREQVSA